MEGKQVRSPSSEVASAAGAQPGLASVWSLVAELSVRALTAMSRPQDFDSERASAVAKLLAAVHVATASDISTRVVDAVAALVRTCQSHTAVQACVQLIRATSEPAVRSRFANVVLQTVTTSEAQVLRSLLAGSVVHADACTTALTPLLWGDEYKLLADQELQLRRRVFVDSCIASPHREGLVRLLLEQPAIKSAIAAGDAAAMTLFGQCRCFSVLRACLALLGTTSEPLRSHLASVALQAVFAKKEVLSALLAGSSQQSTTCATLITPLLWGDECKSLAIDRALFKQSFVDACIASPHRETVMPWLLEQPAIKSAVAAGDAAAITLFGQCRCLSVLQACLALLRTTSEPLRSHLASVALQAVLAKKEVLSALLTGSSQQSTTCATLITPLLWGDEWKSLAIDRALFKQSFVDACIASPHRETGMPWLLEQPAIKNAIATGDAVAVRVARQRLDHLQAQGANNPVVDWSQPAAMFNEPLYPQSAHVQQFLRGPLQVFTVKGFTGIAQARQWAGRFNRSWPQPSYQASAIPGGTGKSSHCTITKKREAFDAEVQRRKQLTQQWFVLRALLELPAAAQASR